MFESVKPGPPDPMYDLKVLADGDCSATKVDLGVGVYRNERGGYHELRSIHAAKKILEQRNPGHDYELTTGNPGFIDAAAQIMFGERSPALSEGRVGSVQTISGTGANHLAALFLRRCCDPEVPLVHIGTPAWGNYEPLCRLVGLDRIVKYRYYDPKQGGVDVASVLGTAKKAPARSIFILQACCHNPSGADMSPEEWQELAAIMKTKEHFPLFDIAYQGLGVSLDEDAYAVRLFDSLGFEMAICQSFSKNLGLYGERCGLLHVVSKSQESARCVKDQLRCLIRWEFSSSPSYGSRLVTIVAENTGLRQDWLDELESMRQRLASLRTQLEHTLVNVYKVPGDWSVIGKSRGLFCLLPLTPKQCHILAQHHQIYLPPTGRINISGLNDTNLSRVAVAIASVVTSEEKIE